MFRNKLLLGYFYSVVGVILAKLAFGLHLNAGLVLLLIGVTISGWRVASMAERGCRRG
jgi:hypothetical protein